MARLIKSLLDKSAAAIAIIMLSPLIILIAIAIASYMGSPVIFTQDRLGINNSIFRLYKFRTMTDARDQDGQLLPDGDRIANFGKWLSQTSLNEIPLLWNILKGDMSFICSRPLLLRD